MALDMKLRVVYPLLTTLLMLVGCTSDNAALPQPINTGAAPYLFFTATPVTLAPPTADAALPGRTLVPTEAVVAPLIVGTLTPYPDLPRFSIGQSVEGRDLWAWQFGEGAHTI